MIRVGGLGASGPATKLWRIAVLTAAGAIVSAGHAEAALFYWLDSGPGYYSQPVPMIPPRQPKARHRQAKKIEAAGKETAKPQGPLIIAISIEKQNLKIYDANGFFAETPVSTGMKGHPTPMGVFSVIQKHKLHHSNIYSGAPMPYMQRITWSGVAIHAGVLPGYPASHGCIRMPMAFAIKMWNWTRMGARVLVTPGEMTPASFSHPLLVTQKVAPQPNAGEPQADAPSGMKSDSDKASDAGAAILPAVSEARLELRSTVGHDDGVKPVMGEPPAPASLREQTHTADASGGMRATKPPATMNDASAGRNASPREEAAARPDSALPTAEVAALLKTGATASTDGKPADIKPSEAATVEIKSAETAATDDASKKPDEVQAPVQASGDAAIAETTATGSVTAEARGDEKKTEAKADDVKAEAPKPDAPKSGERPNEEPDDTAGTVTDIGTSVPVQTASQPNPAAAPKRVGQIAVFVSRKDSKLYVRQNFAPLFEAPVTIAPSDRALGTHVFTAQVDKGDPNIVRWSVVSLPAPVRYAEQRDEDERNLRRRKMAGAVEIKPMPVPDTPTEALDRLAIPADAMARITDAISTGGSIIVSDQGIRAGETGEGTDFIVSLR